MHRTDLTGQRFGRLVALSEVAPAVFPSGRKGRRWRCKCDCGSEKPVLHNSLRNGLTRSCGQCPGQDITGTRFGKLVVIGRSSRPFLRTNGSEIDAWECRCDCGNVKRVRGYSLLNGNTATCGCGHGTHRRSRTPIYETWMRMHRRCRNKGLKNYGSKGVRVCERWNSFENFLADMGECPANHSLDRIDSGGDYEPSNCRWATRVQQNRNTNRNRYISYQGKQLCVSEAAKAAGLDRRKVLWRLNHGWPVERALEA